MTQSGNGRIAGKIIYCDGSPASGALVVLRSDEFNPVECEDECFADTTIADDVGMFVFDSIPADTYVIDAISLAGLRSLHFNTVFNGEEELMLGQDTLKVTGALRVRIPSSLFRFGAYIYVPGTDIFENIDTMESDSGYIILGSVAPGLLLSLYYQIIGESSVSVDTMSLDIDESDTTDIDFAVDDTFSD